MSALRSLRLKPEAERRLRLGHSWVYANEFEGKLGALGLQAGQLVELITAKGRSLGAAYVNPNVLIAGRLLQTPSDGFDVRGWLQQRIRSALALRQRLGVARAGRLIFGESDGLPGLVVDRYGPLLSAQLGTAGMAAWADQIADELRRIEGIDALVWRNDAAGRELEGLPREVQVAFGEVSEPIWIDENGARFGISPVSGQKTGWFYDQRDNRAALMPFVAGARVLDLFSYGGGWGVCSAVHGASSALCVDSSSAALEAVQRNAHASGVGERVSVLDVDAFDACRQLRDAGERFDVVVVDPPAFIKRKKDAEAGTLAYRRINEAALKLVADGGLIVSCSCSHHFSADALLDALNRAACALGLRLRVLKRLAQSADHPIHPGMPETEYLKGFLAEVRRP
ncbi:MAG: class I SAM-dependent rRNA methyltransferase [Xanthomonadales bacterium]|nr:class I SAM-dependent rRNA methyltransferase [Xanthomonadales bacterium]MCB1610250.1 class I SAM-dependent rRNA methyltransferase [Xanthomonadales bacterium]MCP5474074.1 class I SAM-dependent rRNA methyltransferase [Rhodanobacteraceae bacterium]